MRDAHFARADFSAAMKSAAPYKGYADFYQHGPFSAFPHELRLGGAAPVTLILADPEAHEFSDPATPDLLIDCLLEADCLARFNLGFGWEEMPLRGGDLFLQPHGTDIHWEVPGHHRLLVVCVPFVKVRTLAGDVGNDTPSDFGAPHHGPFRDPFVWQLYLRLWKEAVDDNPFERLFTDSALQTLVLALLR